MPKDTNEAYFLVRGESGEKYLCPLTSMGNRGAITEDAMDDRVERDIVEGYSGNLNIKPS